MKYTIPRRATKCFSKEEIFNEGEEIISLIIPVKEGYERRDFCLNCWHEYAAKEDFFWKVQLPTKETRKTQPKDIQTLELFYSLIDQKEKKDLLYVLALFLERRGLFAKRKENLFENIRTGEAFIVEPVPSSSLNYDLITAQL